VLQELVNTGWLLLQAAIQICVVAYLIGLAINRIAPGVLAEPIKNFYQRRRDELNAERTRQLQLELENLKVELEKLKEQNKVQISTLHARRDELIQELYAQLLECQRMWQLALGPTTPKSHPSRERSAREASSSNEKLQRIAEKSRLYLPISALDLITSAVGSLALANELWASGEGVSEPDRQDRYEAIVGQFEIVQQQLEAEFRVILGVG